MAAAGSTGDSEATPFSGLSISQDGSGLAAVHLGNTTVHLVNLLRAQQADDKVRKIKLTSLAHDDNSSQTPPTLVSKLQAIAGVEGGTLEATQAPKATSLSVCTGLPLQCTTTLLVDGGVVAGCCGVLAKFNAKVSYVLAGSLLNATNAK